MPQPKFILFKTILSIIIFMASAVVSTWFYYGQHAIFTFISPGVIYTCATVLVFLLLGKIEAIGKLLIYCCLMVITWYVIWIATLCTVFLGFILGIVTAAIGALITFMLTHKFVTTLIFKKKDILIVGGLSFLITDIFLLSFGAIFDHPPVKYILNSQSATDTIFAEAIFFWQILVGIKLVLTLRKDADGKKDELLSQSN